ncbi:hypothetical protein IT072_19255 [Leifsonia sp. ZF2019]|uniref:hypothetical protein n=1 Tax=unclassified Leifsonia TaxID=2663824 RepID=UPI001CBA7AF7|nr:MULTISPECIES: hypothetical protein [unclassified Leifsonia]UAJ79305.1 hypothetical protein IT072_19255 [Leifsonia sp. ZF2019]
MADAERSLTMLLPGFGLVECVTTTTEAKDGSVRDIRVESAVDKDGRRVDYRTWARIEQLLRGR